MLLSALIRADYFIANVQLFLTPFFPSGGGYGSILPRVTEATNLLVNLLAISCWRAVARQQPILDISEKKNQNLCNVRSKACAVDCGVVMSMIRGIDTSDDVTYTWKGILQPYSLQVECFSSWSSLIIIQPYMFSL